MKIKSVTWNWFVNERPYCEEAHVGINGCVEIVERTNGRHGCDIRFENGNTLSVFKVNSIERIPKTEEEKKKEYSGLPF